MMRNSISIAVVAFSLLFGGAARADEVGDRARVLYERGMAHFQLEEFDSAIEAWEQGFRIKPVPEFLYNIAQAYRLSKRPDKALTLYQNYLRMSPKAPNRAEVEKNIAKLRRAIEENQQASEASPHATKPIAPDPVPPPPRPVAVAPTPAPPPPKPAVVAVAPKPAPPPPKPAPPPPAPPPPKPVVVALAPKPAPPPPPRVEPKPAPRAATPAKPGVDLTVRAPAKKPITKQPWFWGVVGGGAALIVGAVIVGVVVGTSGGASTKTLPTLTF